MDGACVDELRLEEFWFRGGPAVVFELVAPAVGSESACPCPDALVVAQGGVGVVGLVGWLGGIAGVGTGDVGVGGT